MAVSIVVAVVVLDQLTKAWAVSALTGQPSIRVLGDFFMFTLVYNLGGALGTKLGSPTYYLIVALIIFPFIVYYLWHYRRTPVLALPLAFIAGGAIGNIIDRVRIGKVVDFIDVDFFDINLFGFKLERWWTFNVADAAIFCAILFLLVYLTIHRPDPASPAGIGPARPPSEPGESANLE